MDAQLAHELARNAVKDFKFSLNLRDRVLTDTAGLKQTCLLHQCISCVTALHSHYRCIHRSGSHCEPGRAAAARGPGPGTCTRRRIRVAPMQAGYQRYQQLNMTRA